MINTGPDTNGSLYQVTFTQNPEMDERYVVFGALAGDDSFETLRLINTYGTPHGEPLEELVISACAVVYPDPTFLDDKKK
jgi:cyclophilin family peptidyl-prolyl cis-trans isomerase